MGRLVAVHAIAPVYMQRAVFTVVLSFIFFMAMMIAYYIRENIGYFLLASAFLLIYLVMMFSLVMQRRNVVEVFEGGFRYKKDEAAWDEINGVSDEGVVQLKSSRTIAISKSLSEFDSLMGLIRRRAHIRLNRPD